jgi:hypothetical protein
VRDFLRACQHVHCAAHECVGHVEADDVWRELPTRQTRSNTKFPRLCNRGPTPDKPLQVQPALWLVEQGLWLAELPVLSTPLDPQ